MTRKTDLLCRVMSNQDVQVLRKLLVVAEAGAVALDRWPVYDGPTDPSDKTKTHLEKSHDALRTAMLYISEAVYELT